MQVLLEKTPTGVRATTDALGERVSAEKALGSSIGLRLKRASVPG
jgi:hypothetical protein